MVTIDLQESVFSVSHELRLLKLFLRSGQCVFFVSFEQRLEKQLRTAVLCHYAACTGNFLPTFLDNGLVSLCLWILDS